jgi:hypothetical protein
MVRNGKGGSRQDLIGRAFVGPHPKLAGMVSNIEENTGGQGFRSLFCLFACVQVTDPRGMSNQGKATRRAVSLRTHRKTRTSNFTQDSHFVKFLVFCNARNLL